MENQAKVKSYYKEENRCILRRNMDFKKTFYGEVPRLLIKLKVPQKRKVKEEATGMNL
jgi:hypothetical protein